MPIAKAGTRPGRNVTKTTTYQFDAYNWRYTISTVDHVRFDIFSAPLDGREQATNHEGLTVGLIRRRGMMWQDFLDEIADDIKENTTHLKAVPDS